MHADERALGDISFSSAFGNIPAVTPSPGRFPTVGRVIAPDKRRFT